MVQQFSEEDKKFMRKHGDCEDNYQCGGAYVCAGVQNGYLCNSKFEDMRCDGYRKR
jgi:hypothetical protein